MVCVRACAARKRPAARARRPAGKPRGIGGGARTALDQAGIQLYGGVSGSADQAVEDLLAQKLVFQPDIQCSHHEGHEEGHSCGDHGCGSHGCGTHGCH